MSIHTMIVHKNRHMDEDLAYLLVRRFGNHVFGVDGSLELIEISGVNHLSMDNPEVAGLLADALGDDVQETLDADELRRFGLLFVGTGGGEFDEHPKEGESRTDNVSCVRLIADALGDDVPEQIRDLVEYTDWGDARNTPRIPIPFELASLVRVLKNADDVPSDEVTEFLERVLEGRLVYHGDWHVRPSDLYYPELLNAQILFWLAHTFNEGQMPAATDPIAAMEEFGVADEPALQQLIEYLRQLPARAAYKDADPNTNQGLLMYELATLVTLLQEERDAALSEPIANIQWLLTKQYEQQHHFHVVLREEYEECRDLRTVKLANGKKLKAVFIESSTFGLDRCARYFDKAAIIVIRNPETGHVQILSAIKRLQKLGMGYSYTDVNRHTHLDEVAKVIRIAERLAAGRTIPFDPKEIGREGAVKGAECWWYDPRFPALFNGSRSTPDAPATLIPWDELKRLVLLAVDDTIMADCTDTGICARRECPLSLYGLYLKRCYTLRDNEGRCSESAGFLDLDALPAGAFGDDE